MTCGYWIIRWWKSAINCADKFAREDKSAPAGCNAQYRGLATVEMAVPTGRYPTTRWRSAELEPKRDASTSFVVIWRICVILSFLRRQQHGDLRQNRSAAEHFACRRLMLHASRLELDAQPFTGQPLIIQAGLMKPRMQALTQFGWRGLSLTMKRVGGVPAG